MTIFVYGVRMVRKLRWWSYQISRVSFSKIRENLKEKLSGESRMLSKGILAYCMIVFGVVISMVLVVVNIIDIALPGEKFVFCPSFS